MIKQFLFLTVLFAATVQAAVIQGIVYDTTLDSQRNVFIEIDTIPHQKIISKDGAYRLEVPQGNYTVTAKYFEDDILVSSAEGYLEIKDSGNYVFDLILLPVIEEDGSDFSSDISLDKRGSFRLFGVLLVFIIIFFVLIIFIFLKRKRAKKEPLLENDLEKVVQILEHKGKRATQKEIRKELGLSEAKVSLMVTDLESRGIIRKVKRGRGNLIILN